ncbi:MAG: T9SS type A sorting domain-containing protein [Saprospiraceae bacterium]|nr:T9SS type A sorting domain-containing protein [Saprospiraceae bacterium]
MTNEISIENSKNWLIYAYPNPCNDVIKLFYLDKSSGNYEVSIIDYTGKQVSFEFSDVNNNSKDIEIRTSSLPNGLYFIKSISSKSSDIIPFVIAH